MGNPDPKTAEEHETNQTTDRRQRAEAKLEDALTARETPFRLATTITACWRYAVGDDDGAAYGLVAHGHVLWSLIERTIEFERRDERERCAKIASKAEEQAVSPLAGLMAMSIRQEIENG